MMYKFRFAKSKQIISLSDEQITRIPYLLNIVSYPEKFPCERNTDGEFILHYRIRYNWFIAILDCITAEQPSFLLTKLPRRCNVICMLNLYQYLGIEPLPVPALYERNPNTHQLTPNSVRNRTVKFLMALAKKTYDMNVSKTAHWAFYRLQFILTDTQVFGPRFRCHTSVIIETCCRSFFNSKDYSRLPLYKYSDTDSSTDEDEDSDLSAVGNFLSKTIQSKLVFSNVIGTSRCDEVRNKKSSINQSSTVLTCAAIPMILSSSCFLREPFLLSDIPGKSIVSPENEAKWARAGHLNTLPARPIYDRRKHRCKLKAQSYR